MTAPKTSRSQPRRRPAVSHATSAASGDVARAVDAVRRLMRGLRLAEQRTRSTTGLSAQGSVRTERDAADRRRLLVRITAAGQRRLARAPAPPTVQLLSALQRLSERELRGLNDGLGALLGAMGLDEAPASMLFEDADSTATRARSSSARRPRR